MHHHLSRNPHLALWLTTLTLLLMFGLAVNSLVQKSPTMDEQGFLVRGLAYVRSDNRWMRVGHPAGLNMLNAALLKDDAAVKLPIDDPSWQTTEFHRPGELFLWEIGNDVEHVMFLARLPTVWLGMVMVALIGRFARQLTYNAHRSRRDARWMALLAVTLVSLDPNILAHARLITTDLGLVAAAVLATYLLWRYLRLPSWRDAILAGVGFGLLANTKFTAGLFVPLFALLIGVGVLAQWRTMGRFPRKMIGQLLIAYPLAAILTLWAAYGFDVGTLSAELPAYSELLGGRTVPLAHYLDQFADIAGRVAKPTPAFLLGAYSDSGWWYYFPVNFLLKTPLPTLILLILSAVATLLPRRSVRTTDPPPAIDYAAILIPPLGYFAFSMTTDINIGYRHILIVVPFTALFIARQLPYWWTAANRFGRIVPAVAGICVGWLLIVTLWIAPHFLAYFNAFAGGPNNGWQALVDSNLDWGQDLVALVNWMEQTDTGHVYLSYFGEGRPEYYGIDYTGLPSFPPRLMNPNAQPFYPPDPAPGTYAISATNLQGVLFENHDLLAWFRDRETIDKLGYSIFLYDVPPHGTATDLVLGSMPVGELTLNDYTNFGTNDIRYHWFDRAQSMLIVDKEGSWLAVNGRLDDKYRSLYEEVVAADNYTLYRRNAEPLTFDSAEWNPINATFANGDSKRVTLHAYQPTTTIWQQKGESTPLKLFVHVENSDGEIVAQFDGFGAAWEGWYNGDWLIQQHGIDFDTLSPGTYTLYAGIIDPATGTRWQSSEGDRIQLGEVTIE
ncbi:MAG: glycosyltransferase family 39 protein [Anaerolineae bacterium]|nr:glycosyltransferase family 39 protein [Anaerolineae bacterium]